ncbi:MAG TPA: hypothetical protein VHL11_07520, partial [Phototrophicaceae bacterium]|nr:hypothetical protein [Phototrophicaceae bacterium]
NRSSFQVENDDQQQITEQESSEISPALPFQINANHLRVWVAAARVTWAIVREAHRTNHLMADDSN